MGYGLERMIAKVPSIIINGLATHSNKDLFRAKNMQVRASEWTCLLGPSGSGKSTLLRLIAGLTTHVNFFGNIKASDNTTLDGRVAYMAQSDLLLPWLNTEENIRVGSMLRGSEIDIRAMEKIIKDVGLLDHRTKYPSQLSGGQRQRVALARTLMENKPIILLDEPFSSLDAKTRLEMQDLVTSQFIGKTVLLVTHDPNEAVRLCHRIYIFDGQEIESTESLVGPFPKNINDNELHILQAKLLDQIRGNAL